MYKNIVINKNNFDDCIDILLKKSPSISFINNKLPLAIYGFGKLGKMALRFFEINKMKVEFIVDRKINKINLKKKNINLKGISYLSDIKQQINLVICIGDRRFFKIYNKYSKFKNLNCYHFYDFAEKHKKYFYLSNGWSFNINKKNKIKILKVINILSDFRSKLYYVNFLLWHKSRTIFSFSNLNLYNENKYFISPIKNFLKKNNNNILLDVGSYFGDYFKEFINRYNCKSVISVEGDLQNILIQKKKFLGKKIIQYYNKVISNRNGSNFFYSGAGLMSRISKFGKKRNSATIDSLNKNPNIIKIHLEGGEYRALQGAIKTIDRNRPAIMISIYHNADGIYKIIFFLKKILSNYSYYIRGHAGLGVGYYLYCVPKNIIKF
jgi:FkbM family methyltransferase